MKHFILLVFVFLAYFPTNIASKRIITGDERTELYFNLINIAFLTLYLRSGKLLLVTASIMISGGSPPDLTNSGIIFFIYSKSFTISVLVMILIS